MLALAGRAAHLEAVRQPFLSSSLPQPMSITLCGSRAFICLHCALEPRLAASAPRPEPHSPPAQAPRGTFLMPIIPRIRCGPSGWAAEQLDGADPASQALSLARY